MAPEEAGRKSAEVNSKNKSRQEQGGISGKSKTGNEAKTEKKSKPSYKHVPHSQKPAHLVAKRNARERRRVQAVNQAFYRLRKCVPIENRNKRVSKVKTLQRAIDYIRKLERILENDDASNPSGVGGGGGELLVLGDGTVLTTSVSSVATQPTTKPTTGRQKQANNNNNCDRVTSLGNATRQRRPRKSKTTGVVGQLPALETNSLVTTQTVLTQDDAAYMQQETEIVQQQQHQDYYSSQSQSYHQPSELVLRESSAYNSNLNHYYHHQHQDQSPYLAVAAAGASNSNSNGSQYQPQTSQQQSEQPFGGEYNGTGYPTGAYYYYQQQQESGQQQASGGWRNQQHQVMLKAEVVNFGHSGAAVAAEARTSPAADELSPAGPKAPSANRQQVNTSYLVNRMGPTPAAHLSFAANNDNYQQQQLDGRQGRKQHHDRLHHHLNHNQQQQQSADQANCLPANNLHDQQQYHRHFSSAIVESHQQLSSAAVRQPTSNSAQLSTSTNNLLHHSTIQEYGAAI